MLSDTRSQVVDLWSCCIWLVNLFELYDDARTCQRQTEYRLRVLSLTKGQKSEVLIKNFVPKSIKYNKLYNLFFNNLDYIRFVLKQIY